MKAIRQRKILEIISSKPIETQEDLAEELRSHGLEVTQATVSRDIKELRLVKDLTRQGTHRYALPSDGFLSEGNRMSRMFRDSVIRMDCSENLIVIKTLPGTAQAVAFTIDGTGWEEILGTVAGDDTIFVAIKPIDKVEEVMGRMSQLMG